MAIYPSALVTRLREVLEDSAGTLRTISGNDALGGDLPDGLTLNEEARRALAKVRAEAKVTNVRRSPASPPVIGNLALYDIEVEVRTVFPMLTATALDDDARDGIKGVAFRYVDRVVQALTFPGNLTTTTAGAATDLVSGMLAHIESPFTSKQSPGEAGTLEVVHKFKGVIRSAPAI